MIELNDDGRLLRRYDRERLFLDAIFRKLKLADDTVAYLEKEYALAMDTKLCVIGVWLGEQYDECAEEVAEGLRNCNYENMRFEQSVVCADIYQMVVSVFYNHLPDQILDFFQKKLLSEWSEFIPQNSIAIGRYCEGILNLLPLVREMQGQLEWNLLLGDRVLITKMRIENLNITPLKYPAEVEGIIEKTVAKGELSKVTRLIRKMLYDSRKQPHYPREMKSAYMQFACFIMKLSEKQGMHRDDTLFYRVLFSIAEAVSWPQIYKALCDFDNDIFAFEHEAKGESLLVVQAKMLMFKYYSEGITLDEIATELKVTDEYLSSVFRKEVGFTFSEMIRAVRIERVKELLTTTSYKIGQIAKMAGYSDPKYMSKVFKDSVGITPNEYRKTKILSE